MNRLLDRISQPSDLKGLSILELGQLAEEIRYRIIEVLSLNGGHLASNLGVVELILAMHFVFNSPEDKFIFDVSHQSYAHKLLTGRNALFTKIRQHKGLCGFCHPQESSHDHFYAGHAGTALSLGLGVAKSRDLSGRKEHILPILGDATLTCGLTLEALNNVSKNLSNFIVVLNDNARSISENVGNIKNILSRFLSSPSSNQFYHEIQDLLGKIPNYGPKLEKFGKKITESLKNLVSPAPFFEEFGLAYVGPVDGHDLNKLITTFNALKNYNHPVLLHVMTVKGKGMPIAIANPTPYHGARPFDPCSGLFLNPSVAKSTFSKIFGKHLLAMADRDASIVAITPATPTGSCLDEFMLRYPDRCFDVGIAEGHAITFAGGMAADRSKKVIACVYATFLQRALDNVFQDVCMQGHPVVFAVDRAFISGPDGSTHHGIYDIAFFNAMPHIIIAQPRDGHVLKELLESAFSWGFPAVIRYPNLATEDTNLPLCPRIPGKGEILARGKDLLIIALGHQCTVASIIAGLLLEKGIQCTIFDPVFVKPFDEALCNQLLSSHRFVVTLEEHAVNSGVGVIFNSLLVKYQWIGIRVLNFGIPDIFVQFGSHEELIEELGLDPYSIVLRILDEWSEQLSPALANNNALQPT